MTDQIQMEGILIFLGDFRHARRFASEILRAKFHTRNRTQIRDVTHLALNTALIVSYGRPFFTNYNFGNGISSLKSCAETVLTDSQDLKLHNKVLSLRLKVYAHSDGDSHLLTDFNYNGPGPKCTKDPFAMLDKSETRRLKAICDRWVIYLDEHRAGLKALSG
jgi:hypothetical protein